MKDIENLYDIKILVNTFYEKVQNDNLLSPIFAEVVKDNWPTHLEKMYRFWQTILLLEHTYSGSPFKHHANLPVKKDHFDRWMKLFRETVNAHFKGDKAEEAISRAANMAVLFNYKIEHLRENKNK